MDLSHCVEDGSNLKNFQLTLTDRSVTVQRESSSALGQGCRLGFLGTLHMDVFRQRLEDEHDANIIITAPTVPYKSIILCR
jgi:translation factor GUF1, mitochondrial